MTALPLWATRCIYTGGAVFGTTVVAMSSVSLWSLAVEAGWSPLHALGPPVAFDACALIAGVAWAAGSGTVRRYGWAVTWGLILASAGCNAAAALSGFGMLPAAVRVWLFVTVPALFPVVAGLIVHLVLLTRRAGDRGTRRGTVPAPKPEPSLRPRPEVAAPEDEVAARRRRERDKKARQRARKREAAAVTP